jgi:hypothetical protein
VPASDDDGVETCRFVVTENPFPTRRAVLAQRNIVDVT